MRKIGSYPVSDLADAFPEIEGDQFKDLVASIGRFGLQTPITLNSKGEVLDGRNRLRACIVADVEPDFEEFDGSRDDQIEFVKIANLERRDLTQSQRALVVAAFLAHKHGNKLPNFAVQEASEASSLGEGTIRRAQAVLRDTPDNVVKMVRDGDMSLHKANQVAKGEVTAEEAVSTARKSSPGRPRGDHYVTTIMRGARTINEVGGQEARIASNLTHDQADELRQAGLHIKRVLAQLQGERDAAAVA